MDWNRLGLAMFITAMIFLAISAVISILAAAIYFLPAWLIITGIVCFGFAVITGIFYEQLL